VKILLVAVLIGLATPACAVRATASATILAAADVAALQTNPAVAVAVSVSTLRAGSYAYVTVAFN